MAAMITVQVSSGLLLTPTPAAIAPLPQPKFTRAKIFLAATRSEKRRLQKRARDLAHAMVELKIPGNAATRYADVLAARGIELRQLSQLDVSLLDECDMRSSHRQVLKASGVLLTGLENEEAFNTAAATPSTPTASGTAAADSTATDDDDDAATAEEAHVVVSAELDGARLDAILAALLPPMSRSYFAALCTEGRVLVDGSPGLKKSAKIAAGTPISVKLRAVGGELSVTPEAIPLEVLYEDEYLLAIDKPPGMVVHPAPGHWSGTFANALAHHVLTQQQPGEAPPLPPPALASPPPLADSTSSSSLLPDAFGDGLRPGIVHRLDRYTSGVLLGAKTVDAQRNLLSAFQKREVSKVYLAITAGAPAEQPIAIVEEPIGRHPIDRVKMAVAPSGTGRKALSMVHTLASGNGLGLVAVRIGTGRTHQIRVHLKHLNCPVLGDPIYGDANRNKREGKRASRPLLHAHRLNLAHPIDPSSELKICASVPADLAAVAAAITGRDDEGELDAWLAEAVDEALAEGAEEFARLLPAFL